MALKLKQSQEKNIEIKNVDIELAQVYGRFDWNPDITGKKINCRILWFKDKNKWTETALPFVRKEDLAVTINVPSNYSFTLEANEEASVGLTENKLIAHYNELGYDCEKWTD